MVAGRAKRLDFSLVNLSLLKKTLSLRMSVSLDGSEVAEGREEGSSVRSRASGDFSLKSQLAQT